MSIIVDEDGNGIYDKKIGTYDSWAPIFLS